MKKSISLFYSLIFLISLPAAAAESTDLSSIDLDCNESLSNTTTWSLHPSSSHEVMPRVTTLSSLPAPSVHTHYSPENGSALTSHSFIHQNTPSSSNAQSSNQSSSWSFAPVDERPNLESPTLLNNLPLPFQAQLSRYTSLTIPHHSPGYRSASPSKKTTSSPLHSPIDRSPTPLPSNMVNLAAIHSIPSSQISPSQSFTSGLLPIDPLHVSSTQEIDRSPTPLPQNRDADSYDDASPVTMSFQSASPEQLARRTLYRHRSGTRILHASPSSNTIPMSSPLTLTPRTSTSVHTPLFTNTTPTSPLQKPTARRPVPIKSATTPPSFGPL